MRRFLWMFASVLTAWLGVAVWTTSPSYARPSFSRPASVKPPTTGPKFSRPSPSPAADAGKAVTPTPPPPPAKPPVKLSASDAALRAKVAMGTSAAPFKSRAEAASSFQDKYRGTYSGRFDHEPARRPTYIPATYLVSGRTVRIEYSPRYRGYGYWSYGIWYNYDPLQDAAMLAVLMAEHPDYSYAPPAPLAYQVPIEPQPVFAASPAPPVAYRQDPFSPLLWYWFLGIVCTVGVVALVVRLLR